MTKKVESAYSSIVTGGHNFFSFEST